MLSSTNFSSKKKSQNICILGVFLLMLVFKIGNTTGADLLTRHLHTNPVKYLTTCVKSNIQSPPYNLLNI